MKSKTLLLITYFFIISDVIAVQRYTLSESKRIEMIVSNTELNRLRVEGDRIKEVVGLSKNYQVEYNGTSGQIFIRTTASITEPTVFSAITEKGKTQDIKFIPKKVSGEIIILETSKDSFKKSEQDVGIKNKEQEEIVEIIKTITLTQQSVNLIDEKEIGNIKASLVQIKKRGGYTVEVWTLKNISQNIIEVVEKGFEFPGKVIKAIALEKNMLTPEEMTIMYVVML